MIDAGKFSEKLLGLYTPLLSILITALALSAKEAERALGSTYTMPFYFFSAFAILVLTVTVALGLAVLTFAGLLKSAALNMGFFLGNMVMVLVTLVLWYMKALV